MLLRVFGVLPLPKECGRRCLMVGTDSGLRAGGLKEFGLI